MYVSVYSLWMNVFNYYGSGEGGCNLYNFKLLSKEDMFESLVNLVLVTINESTEVIVRRVETTVFRNIWRILLLGFELT